MSGRAARGWKLPSAEPSTVRALSDRHQLDPLLAAVLVRRGISEPVEVDAFLGRGPLPPVRIDGMQSAVERIGRCAGRPVFVYGDPDVDGIAATAIMVELLRRMGAPVRWRIPPGGRHGLPDGGVREARTAGAELVVCVDCSIGPAESREAARSGIDVLVVDHHRPIDALPLDSLPETVRVLNPALSGAAGAERLAAGAVALKLAEAVRQAANAGGAHDVAATQLPYDLAMLSTLADRMPLTGESRRITALGLDALARSDRPGLLELWLRVGRSVPVPSADQVSRTLNPVIGSAARYGDGDHAVQLLVSRARRECAELSDRLQELDARRRRESAAAWNRLLPRARHLAGQYPEARCLVVDDRDLARGLTGPLAYRLSRFLDRSVAVVAYDGGFISGSIRSPDSGANALVLLADTDGLLTSRGGHRSAGGFVAPADVLTDVRRRWSDRRHGTAHGRREPARVLDAEVPARELTPALDRLVAAVEPTGVGNGPVVLRTRGLEVSEVSLFGRASEHCKLLLDAGAYRWPALYWGAGPRAGEFGPGDTVDVVYRLEPGYSDGERRLRMIVLELCRR